MISKKGSNFVVELTQDEYSLVVASLMSYEQSMSNYLMAARDKEGAVPVVPEYSLERMTRTHFKEQSTALGKRMFQARNIE